MTNAVGRAILDQALSLARSHPTLAAIAILDFALQGNNDSHPDFRAEGEAFDDWLDPPSPFAELLRRAFAPDLPSDVDVWGDDGPNGQLWAEHWRERVWEPFAERYGLWRL